MHIIISLKWKYLNNINLISNLRKYMVLTFNEYKSIGLCTSNYAIVHIHRVQV